MPTFKQILALLTAVAVAIAAAIPAFAEVRTWTDTQGRTVEAEMVGVESGAQGPVVNLKLATGKIVPFPFRMLSQADQKFLSAQMPLDPARAAAQIDKLVFDKLKAANGELRAKIAVAAADRNLPREDRLKQIEELEFLEKQTHPNDKTTDEQFVRRIYLDIAGRIPTYEEATSFLESSTRDKRARLIDQLLDSEAFASHQFNQLSDLLRVRSQLTMNGGGNLQARAYMDWLRDQIRANRPWDEVVAEMVTAKGTLWENPAVGFMFTDYNMPLCNLSNTFTVFMGTEITCAQCHDHPFEEVYQMDFYKMAAFFGKMEYRYPDQATMARMKAEEERLQAELAALNPDPNMRRDQQLSQIMGSYQYALGDGDENKTRLPHDYKYDDGDPLQVVEPATYFGDIVDLEEFENPRLAFAAWLTSKDNPRFTINIVNRLWKQVFGLAQIEPVHNIPGHLDGQAQNYELLTYLEKLMKDLDYNLKDFLRVLYNTEAYQREASHFSPTLAQVDKGEYHFPAPILRRMSAEQIWDSLVTMAAEKGPEDYQVRVLEPYRELMSTDWSAMTGQQAMKFKEDYRTLTSGGMMMQAQDMMASRVGGEMMVRASEMEQPAPDNHFLNSFGQSNKLLIENSTKLGSVPQVMMLMNGRITNQTLAAKDSKLMQSALGARGRGDTVDKVFLSILSRYPTQDEKSVAQKAIRTTSRDGEGAEVSNYASLIWALLNTREFMFVQ